MVENILYIIAGILILFAGRSVFWLFVGILGFVYGADVSSVMINNPEPGVVLLVGFLGGLVGVILALLFYRVAAAFAGFMAAGYIATNLWVLLTGNALELAPIIFLIGGIPGAIIAFLFLDWAIIALSSLVGAVMVSQTLLPSAMVNGLVVVILCFVGIMVQAGRLKKTT